MSDPTEYLITKAQAGSREALDELFARYSSRILAIVRLRLGPALRSNLESVDVAQSVLLDAFKGLDKFRGGSEGAFLHWLGRMAENKIRDKVDYFRAAKRKPPVPVVSMSEPGGQTDSMSGAIDLVSSGQTPSQKIAMHEDLRRLETALAKLPEDYREVIIMAQYEGLSFLEIAEHVGRSPDACRMLLVRALARLTETFVSVQNDDS